MEDIFKQINTEGSTNDSGAKTTDEKKAGNDE
jgi:hypothetical protein